MDVGWGNHGNLCWYLLSLASFRGPTNQKLQPLSHENICVEKKHMEKQYARYHMREDQISRLEVRKCSTVEKKPPNELRNVDFLLDCRTFSKVQLQNSLKIVGGATFSASKHHKIAICPLISSTDFAKIIKPSLYFTKSMLRKYEITIENTYNGVL